MTSHRALNLTLVAVIVLLLAVVGPALDGPSEIETTQAVAADLQDAIQTAQAGSEK